MRRYHSSASRRIRNRRRKACLKQANEMFDDWQLHMAKPVSRKEFLDDANYSSWHKRRPFESGKYYSRWNQYYKTKRKHTDQLREESLNHQLFELNNEEWLDKRDEEFYWENFWTE